VIRIAARFALAAALLSGAAVAPHAAEVAGVRLDDTTSVAGRTLALNGAGLRTRLVFKVYVASLYLPQHASDLSAVLAQSPRRIQLNLLRDLTADQLVDALNEGLEANNSASELAAVKAQSDQLAGIMKAFHDIKDKDVVALDFVDDATRIVWNGEVKGTIPGAALNQALTRIWLGDKPVQADLKKALLGG
jgi:long-chain acyl-CoA synthetase